MTLHLGPLKLKKAYMSQDMKPELWSASVASHGTRHAKHKVRSMLYYAS